MTIRNVRDVDQVKTLIDYMQRNLKKGYTLESLKLALISQGNSRIAVEKAAEYIKEVQDIQKKKSDEVKAASRQEFEAPAQEEPVVEKKGFWQRIKDFVS